MGAFFTNLLVRTQDVEAVVRAVSSMLAVGGWKRVETAEDGRNVLVVAAGEWVAVYDQGTEEQLAGVLEDVAKDVSMFLGAHAVATLVEDGSYLLVQLFDAGEAIGFVERGESGVSINTGALRPWLRLFPDPARLTAAAEAMKAEHVLVEDNLRAFASALDLPRDAIATGFRYATESPATGARMLSFVPAPPETPRSPDVRPVHAQEPAPHEEGGVTWGCTFRNHGAGFRGVRVVLGRTNGDVRIARVSITVGGSEFSSGEPASVERRFDPPLALEAPLVLDLEDLQVPAGAPEEYLAKLKLIGFEAWARTAMPALLTFDIEVTSPATGLGMLTLATGPLGETALAQLDVVVVA